MTTERSASPQPEHLSRAWRDELAQQPQGCTLRAAEQRYLLESMPELAWAGAEPGQADYLSPQWLAYTGTRAAEVLGAGWLQLVHPEDREAITAALATLGPEARRFALEYRLRRHDGVYRWFRAQGMALQGDHGKVLRWFGLCVDIDDLKQAQARAADAERRYTALFNNRTQGVVHGRIITDGEGRAVDFTYLRVNDTTCRILGKTPDELHGQRFTQTYPELRATDPALVDRHARVAFHGEEAGFEVEFEPGRWASVYLYSPVHGEFVSLFSDITAQKRAEAELRKREAELRATFEQAGLGITHINRRGNFFHSNPHFCELTGYGDAELSQLSVRDLAIGADRKRAWRDFERMLNGQSTALFERRYRRRDGSIIWARIAASAVTHPDTGEFRFIIAMVEDITERKRLEGDLQHAHRELEQRVEQRTQELRHAWQQAEDALAKARAADRVKSDFLTTMSHEIRTPLNAVLGFNALLLDSPLAPEQRRHAELAQQSGQHLLHLLNDFLDYSKIEAGRLEIETTDFDVHAELRQLLSLVAAQAAQKGLALREKLQCPRLLRGDAGRLRQILLNLLANALKFTEHGHVELRCRLASQQNRRAWLLFEIEDSGVGISVPQGELFQPFVQAETSTTRRFGGTGLGLAISKRLAEAMGGHIGYQSVPGAGSTFWVELPFEVLPDSAAATLATRREAVAAVPCQGRVLIVEDNPASQVLLVTLLTRLGCRVDVANNGQEAIEAWERQPYDLVIMDIDMPVMNGYIATRAIRAREQPGQRAPIIACSASALSRVIDSCVEAGMDDFIAKPVDQDELVRKIVTWLAPKEKEE
ncbi:MAG: two-component hybrid sensor and regulator [Moraxellaceae bacterium]|jgi:PAS domain S-box-containing protein|nr:two-component hybrid sensor and regulator [Moraxellaceae bacterium]